MYDKITRIVDSVNCTEILGDSLVISHKFILDNCLQFSIANS